MGTMKKTIILLIVAIVAVTGITAFAACGYGSELTLSMGDGLVPDDAVSIQLKYNDTWNDGDVIYSAKFGHESEAVLADEYTLAFSDANPSSDSYTLKSIFSFTKAALEPNTVSGGRFSGDANEIKIDDLSQYLPEGEGVLTVYLVFYSTDTDFGNITTYASHEIQFEWVSDTQVQLV